MNGVRIEAYANKRICLHTNAYGSPFIEISNVLSANLDYLKVNLVKKFVFENVLTIFSYYIYLL